MSELFDLALTAIDTVRSQDKEGDRRTSQVRGKNRKVPNRTISYTERHKGQWFRPEYPLSEISVAQHTDSYFARTISKKADRVLISGHQFVGKNPGTLAYVKSRIREMEVASNQPFAFLLNQTAADLLRFSNCAWVKVRNVAAATGSTRALFESSERLEPVAGYFALPFETLEFKSKRNGEVKKIRQIMPTGDRKEFAPEDIIHFHRHKKPGFSVGTPEIVPVLDDISLLRRIEENIEELLESNLYPLFHYKVGTDNMPERYSPEGWKETDIIRNTIEYMPAGGIYISDHRHDIKAIGSEGRALKAEGYLEYFKKRIFAGLGMSAVDFGEGDSSNRSTADVLSKSALADVEALMVTMKIFIDFFVISEILKEGPFGFKGVIPEDDLVEIKFGVVDKESQIKLENQTIQLWQNNLITESEARKALGKQPLEDEDRDSMFFKLYEEQLALIRALGTPGGEAATALEENENSAISSRGVNRAIKVAKVGQKQAGSATQGRPATRSPKANVSKNISRPANQTGSRSAPKLSRDKLLDWANWVSSNIEDQEQVNQFNLKLDVLMLRLDQQEKYLEDRIKDPEVVFSGAKWRFEALEKEYLN